ncbi:hypothetical protein EC988_000170 [Linderina pennispora]|nr:hypothetical protein EC988_000170 [Linderina pennispora]
MDSPVQTLPSLVLERILDFAVGSFPHEFTPMGLPTAISTGNQYRVRKVSLHWKVEAILDGTAINAVKNSLLGKLVMPSVASLDFYFCSDQLEVDLSEAKKMEHVKAFCSEIYKLFPSVQSYHLVKFDGYDELHDYPEVPAIDSLITGLTKHKTLVDFSCSAFVIVAPLPIDGRDLRCVSTTALEADQHTIELIRRSASTLECLTVQGGGPEVFAQLLHSEDGKAVVYTHVHSLEMSYTVYRSFREAHPTFASPTGVYFPALRKLVSKIRYPFSNDVLFRGSETTLEYLDIPLLPRTVSDLQDCGVFNANRFPALKYVNGKGDRVDDEMTRIQLTGSLLRLAANARVIKASENECPFDLTGFAISEFGQNVTVLDIPPIRLTLMRTLQLIKVLPRLQQLRTGVEITDELRTTDQSHDSCVAECRPLWIQRREGDPKYMEFGDPFHPDIEDDIVQRGLRPDAYECFYSSRFIFSDYFGEFILDHLSLVYADLEFVDELYSDFYPLSESLAVLDCSHDREESAVLLARSKIAVILLALCPSIQRIQTCWAIDFRYTKKATPDDISIERQRIVESEQHQKFVAHLRSVAQK